MLAVVEDQVPQVLLFQFFIGDAPWGTVASTASASSTCFHSLLEMPMSAMSTPVVLRRRVSFNSLLEMHRGRIRDVAV